MRVGKAERTVTAICGTIIAIGVLARLVRYAACRSLWLDEALLAGNVLRSDFAALASPLSDHQSAPLLFLYSVKALTLLAGTSEYVLRALPLLFSLATLAAAWKAATLYFADNYQRWLFVALLAQCEALVFYSSEFKPYSSDAFFSVSLLAMGLAVREGNYYRWWQLLLLAAAGLLAMSFSAPALFACSGIGAVLWIESVRNRRVRDAAGLLFVGATWLTCFALQYRFLFAPSLQDGYFRRFWARDFPPIPPTDATEFWWFLDRFLGFFNDPLSLTLYPVAAAAFVIGIAKMVSGDRVRLALVLAPLVMTLLASALGYYPLPTRRTPSIHVGEYPFIGRLLLFAVPSVSLLLVKGLEDIVGGRRPRQLLALSALLALFVPAGIQLALNLNSPPAVQELRSVLEAIHPKLQRDDHILVQTYSEPVYEYYAPRLGMVEYAVTRLRRTPDNTVSAAKSELESLTRGQRLWLLSIDHPTWMGHPERERNRTLLSRRAVVAEHHEAVNATATLFIVQ